MDYRAHVLRFLLCLCAVVALICPRWKLSDHSSISTDAVAFGTTAVVACDAGFIFPDGSLLKGISCIAIGDVSHVATWNDTEAQLTCQCKSPHWIAYSQ